MSGRPWGKYGAKPTVVDGVRFASKKEARRYSALKLMVAAGQIEALELQPRFPLVIHSTPVVIRSKGFPNGRPVAYIADFAYREFDAHGPGVRIVEDVKGMDTPVSRLKRALVEAIYGVRVRVL